MQVGDRSRHGNSDAASRVIAPPITVRLLVERFAPDQGLACASFSMRARTRAASQVAASDLD